MVVGVAIWTRAANMVHKCLGTNLPDEPEYTPPWEIPEESDDEDEEENNQDPNNDDDNDDQP
eukprot:1694979-Heterocapsa_arctica.AAC.1